MAGSQLQAQIARAASALTRAGLAHRWNTGLQHVMPTAAATYEAGLVLCRRVWTENPPTASKGFKAWIPFAQTAAVEMDRLGAAGWPTVHIDQQRQRAMCVTDVLVDRMVTRLGDTQPVRRLDDQLVQDTTEYGRGLQVLIGSVVYEEDKMGGKPTLRPASFDAVEEARRELLLLLLAGTLTRKPS